MHCICGTDGDGDCRSTGCDPECVVCNSDRTDDPEGPASVELDWADDRDLTGEKHAALYGVTALVVKLDGGGGGWPVVRFSGPLSVVAQLEADYWDGEFNDTEIVL